MNRFELLDSVHHDDVTTSLNLALVEDGAEFYWWIPDGQRYSQGFKSEANALKALRDGKLWFVLAKIH